jgi:outer membrane PBP1 activator LpoA protein
MAEDRGRFYHMQADGATPQKKTDWNKVAQRRVENQHAIRRTEEAVNRLRETLKPHSNKK